MHLVVGLGNPGKDYLGTRHNVGFEVLDRLAAGAGAAFARSKFQTQLAGISAPVKTKLAKPMTYMNLSGKAVRALVDYYEIALEQLLVICDDIDLGLGVLRIRPGGGSGGQNGLKSIAEHLGTQDFPRMRIGIDRDNRLDPADYVLRAFSSAQRKVIEPVLDDAVNAVTCWLEDGIQQAMNQHNG